jgi:hypothetical protein
MREGGLSPVLSISIVLIIVVTVGVVDDGKVNKSTRVGVFQSRLVILTVINLDVNYRLSFFPLASEPQKMTEKWHRQSIQDQRSPKPGIASLKATQRQRKRKRCENSD